MSRTGALLSAVVRSVAVVVVLTACSADPGLPSRSSSGGAPSSGPSASSGPDVSAAYDAAVLQDAPVGYWPLRDVAGAASGSLSRDFSASAAVAKVTGSRLVLTRGPRAEPAVAFTGAGRVVAPSVAALAPGHPFTIEFAFRADSCTRSWSQVAGTASFDRRGRQGVNVLHYPTYWPTGCHLAVELWRNDRYEGGCGTPAAVDTGTWLHFAVTYDGRTSRCYSGGVLVGTARAAPWGGAGDVPFGIGGAGSGYGGSLDSGSLADVAVYGTPLTVAQIMRHAASLHGR